jgi:hypothetical protein
MTGGKNGSTPLQNLTQLRRKPVFEVAAELEHSKCPSHPTKRMWTNEIDAIREAEVRSIAAKIPIAAYRCTACGDIHLAKRTNVREGSLIERPPLPGSELPVVLGNPEAKRKALREYLESHETATTADLCELLDIGRKSLTSYMADHPTWYNTRGAAAVWKQRTPAPVDEPVDNPPAPANFEVFKGKGQSARNLKALDAAQSRHPSSQNVGWKPMENLERIRHMPIGDLLDTFAAAGMDVRILVRQEQ